MKKLVVIAIAILLGAAPSYATEVNTISLRYMPNQTIATIHVDGQVRVTHQTEIPKEGRGHRVIVDLLAATHNLISGKFENLPDCMIKSIRSSQYAVSPEQITRVVFDVDQAPIYRIETDQQSVTIYFTDKNVKQFTAWNSKLAVSTAKPTEPVKVVSSKSKESAPVKLADSPVKPSQPVVKPTEPKPLVVASKSAEKTVEIQTPPTVPSKPVSQPKTVRQDNNNDAEIFAMSQRVANVPAPTKDKPVTPTVTAQKPEPKATDSKNSSERRPVVVVADNGQSKAPETTLVIETPNRMPLKSEMKSAEETTSQPAQNNGQSALAGKIAGGTEPSAPEVAQAVKPEPQKASTSRFRRAGSQVGVKGTMVVEFPKRLVIKYKGTKYRDPFETLINANRTTNNPIEKQVPNIDGLRLVGVIESDAKSDRALFEDTDGFGYILKSGDKVRNGYVLRVESDKVYFQIFEYGWSRTVALQLEE